MRIAYVNGVCVRHDAISKAIHDEISWLSSDGHELRLFAYACDFTDIKTTIVHGPGEVVLSSYFQSCDLVVFHFGVYSPLFDAIFAVPTKSRKLVVFHNITPREFCPHKARLLIDRSFSQMGNISFADKVICDSVVNKEVLVDAGIMTPSEVVPLSIERVLPAPLKKPSFTDGILRVAFVGRVVQSKGALELLQAVKFLLEMKRDWRVRIDIMCNTSMSDIELLNSVKISVSDLCREFKGRVDCVLHENGSDSVKATVLGAADIFCLPTRHEGFCVPIVEAIAAGCKVLSYSNSNVPWICGGLARLVPTGDLGALLDAFVSLAKELSSAFWREGGGYDAYVIDGGAHIARFSAENVKRQFVTALL